MKRICLFLTTLLFLAGCQQQELAVQAPSDAPRDLREVIVTASIADDQQATRTSYNEAEAKNYWTPGDKIKIFSAGYASEFTSINTVPEPIVKFQGLISFITGSSNDTDETRHYVWGLYPYSEGASYAEPDGISKNATITTDFSAVQNGSPGTFSDNLTVMIGRSESLSIPFKGAYSGAFFKVNRDDIVSITLRGLNNEVLAGTATLGLDENLIPVVRSVSNPKTSVTVTAPRSTFEPGVNYFLVTLPDVALPNGYSVTLRRSDGYEGTYELRANRPLNRIKFRNLSDPVDVRIEDPANIANGVSTGWVKTETPLSHEIWYKTSDNSNLIAYYHLDGETGNEINYSLSSGPDPANGYVGVISFAAPVSEIDAQAFQGLDKLTSITLPNSVQTIKAEAFSECDLLSEVNLGTGVKEILHSAFSSCGSLTDIDFLPEGLERVGVNAFSHCGSLASVAIPSTVEVLGSDRNPRPEYNPFGYCQNLSSFSGKFATSDGLALVQTYNNTTYLVSFAPKRVNDKSYTVPDDVDVILESVFACAPINNVVLPDGLREISSSAFYNCSGLTSITIPSGVRRIDKCAFQDCRNLEWIRLECEVVPQTNYSGGTDYGFDAFAFSFCPIYVPANLLNAYETTSPWSDYEGRYMVADREIRFTTDDPETVNELLAGYKAAGKISDYYVDGVPEDGVATVIQDSYQGSVYFDNDLTEVPDFFFKNMSSILTVEIMSEKVTRIGDYAFSGTGITEIVLPESVTEIGTRPFSDTPSLASFNGASPLISSDGRYLVTSEGKLGAFAGAGLNGIYSIPEGVTQIEDMNSAPFSTVYMPLTVQSISPDAFKNCANLSEIILSPSINAIGTGAFEGCSSLTKVILDRTTPPFITQGTEAGVFGVGDLCNNFFKVYVPASAFNTYRVSSGWDYIYAKGHLTVFRPSQANNEIWYTVTSGYNGANLDFRGIQDVFDEGGQWSNDYDADHGVWVATFSFDLTEIPDQALYRDEYLKTILLPQSVTKVGNKAFSECSNLVSVDLPVGLQEIGDQAFSFTNLSEVIIPEGVTTLGNAAFGNCESLVNVSLPASYNPQSAIDIYPFEGSRLISSFSGSSQAISSDGRCLVDLEGRLFAFAPDGLAGGYYTIPDGVVTIGLMNQAGFKSVHFPNSVKVIDQGAFFGCSQLGNVKIGAGVEDIRDAAFQNCSSLRSVTIPPSVRSIRNYAFKGCSSLNTVIMVNCVTPPQLYANNQTFGDTNDTFKIVIPGAGYQAYCAAIGWTDLQSHFDLTQTNREIWFTTVSGEEIDMRGVTGEDPYPFYFANGGVWVAVFNDPLTSIPDQAFWKDSDLKTIILPQGIQSIGSQAFSLCSQLESVKLLNPEALTTIGSSAFSTSQKLKVVGGNVEPIDGKYITDLPAVTSLGSSAFYQASKITHVRLPVIETLSNSPFYLSGITSLDIPNVKNLGANAIYGTSPFKILNLPSVEVIGNGALGMCRFFEEIHIGPNIVNMEANVFQQDPYVNYPLTGSAHIQQLKFYIEATTPPAVSSETFKLMNDADHGGPVQVQKIHAVYVPAASEAAYEAAWADALSIALPDGMTVAQVIQPMP